MRKAKAMQLNLADLTNGQNPADRVITKDLEFRVDTNLADMVAEVRAYLGVSLDDQILWNSPEVALKEWRAALLNAGIFVFKDAFRIEGYSGFCLYDDEFPVIYVNNSSTKTRQIFTFFHELAHLIFHTSGIDKVRDGYIERLVGDDRQIEILCNSFAANFLVPEHAFEMAMAHLEATEATAELLADRFSVSREVIFRRFLDQGRVDQHQYDRAVARWNNQRQQGAGGAKGGNPYWTKLTYLGREYVGLALGQYHQNQIDEDQLAEFLDWKPKNVSTLEDYFSRGAV